MSVILSTGQSLPETPVATPGSAKLLPGGLNLSRDHRDSLIVVRGHGLWTVAQMMAHLDDYRSILRWVRADGAPGRVLVVLTDAGVQLPEVTQALAEGTADCHQTGDRVAMVVPGALARMQMRRILGEEVHEFFASEKAARAWLSEP